MGKLFILLVAALLAFIAFLVQQWLGMEVEPNLCAMTFMWRQMSYMDVGLRHERYSFWLYGEGNYAQKFRDSAVLDGLPILFVPGHAGSGRQVRSLGSLLQNKTELLGTPFHFDTFALDFNEELTALSFDYIDSQALFLHSAIAHILSLYPAVPSRQIVLVGHSMGGIVIQALLANPNLAETRTNIAFALTFATPYTEPPFLFDRRFSRFWAAMNRVDTAPDAHIKLISVSGGIRDEFIEEGWTVTPRARINAHAAAMERVWLDMDHRCILWCNQLVRQTSRFLFDYGRNPQHFLEHFDEFGYLHYNTVGTKLINPVHKNGTEELDLGKCVPKCPTFAGPIKFDMSKHNNGKSAKLLLAISPPFIVDHPKFQLFAHFSKCDQLDGLGTRFLDMTRLFALLNLSKCDQAEGDVLVAPKTNLWLISGDFVMPTVFLSAFNFLWHPHVQLNFSMEVRPLLIVPIQFAETSDFAVFRVRISRQKCAKENAPHRTIFMAHGVPKRFDNFPAIGDTSSLLIYPPALNAELVLIDTGKCAQYSVQISLDIRNSLIKLFRRNQRYLPASLVALATIVPIYANKVGNPGFKRFAVFTTIVALILSIKKFFSIDTLFVLLLGSFAHLLLQLLISFLLLFALPIYPFSFLRRPIFFILAIMALAFYFLTYNSLPIGLFSLGFITFLRGCTTPSEQPICSSYLALPFLSLLFQLPHTISTGWNLVKYGLPRWPLPSDPFFATNFSLFIFTFSTFFLRFPIFHSLWIWKIYGLKSPHIVRYFILLSLFLYILLFRDMDSSTFLFVLDDLSLLTNFVFIIFA